MIDPDGARIYLKYAERSGKLHKCLTGSLFEHLFNKIYLILNLQELVAAKIKSITYLI